MNLPATGMAPRDTKQYILTVNRGSSSLRLDIFRAAHGHLQRAAAQHTDAGEAAVSEVVQAMLARHAHGNPLAVAHRVVHGGARLRRSCVIDAVVEREIDDLSALAPLHNPQALAGIRACRTVLGPSVPQVAVFDTAYFADLPEPAQHYALPDELVTEFGLRRYGFHGIAHQAMWRHWQKEYPHRAGEGRVITLQLGAGCSITAHRDGCAVDTSMGFSPLAGLVMATRSGDVDPGLLLYLQQRTGMDAQRLEQILNRESGLLGVSGYSADMRVLLSTPDRRAQRAVDLYCYRARQYLGAYLNVLGGADAIVFGGGVGENAPEIRARLLDGMAWCGVELDRSRNQACVGVAASLHTAASRTAIHVAPVDEATLLAEEAYALTASHAAGASV